MKVFFPPARVNSAWRLITALVAIPIVLFAQAESAADGGALAPVVRRAFETGFGGPLGGRVCTALGLTKNDEPLPVERLHQDLVHAGSEAGLAVFRIRIGGKRDDGRPPLSALRYFFCQ